MPVMDVRLFEEMAAPNENRYETRYEPASSLPRHGSRWVLFMLLAIAAVFRFLDLGLKPPHFDEGINGHFVMTIWRDGFYSYDPTNFHGPLYFYFCHLAEVLFGRSVESFRVMNAALSLGLVYAIYRLREFLGREVLLAALIVAVSPAFTFYGRYAIHETLFVLGQVMFVYGRFAWMRAPGTRAMAWMVSGFVVQATTKETFFIFFGTWLIAEIAIRVLEKFEGETSLSDKWARLSPTAKRQLWFEGLGLFAVGMFVLAALYSGFFERAQGVVDFFRAFNFWSATGTKGNGHEKPFFYWIEMMFRYEWPLLIGLATAVYGTICLRAQDRRLRILLLAGFGHWLAYSIVPYKTPWLILNFWPLVFWPSAFVRLSSKKMLYGIRVLAGLTIVVAFVQAWRLNFENYADGSEPYVYVQTTKDYSTVMNVLRRKVSESPEVRNASIVVMIQDPWPLPYDLSLFPKMRYARIEEIDRDPSIARDAALVLIDGSILDGLRHVMPKRFARLKFQLRDAYGAGWALFDEDMFRSQLPADVAIEEPAIKGSAKPPGGAR